MNAVNKMLDTVRESCSLASDGALAEALGVSHGNSPCKQDATAGQQGGAGRRPKGCATEDAKNDRAGTQQSVKRHRARCAQDLVRSGIVAMME